MFVGTFFFLDSPSSETAVLVCPAVPYGSLFLCFQGSHEEDVVLTAYVVGAFLEVGFDSSVRIPLMPGFT